MPAMTEPATGSNPIQIIASPETIAATMIDSRRE